MLELCIAGLGLLVVALAILVVVDRVELRELIRDGVAQAEYAAYEQSMYQIQLAFERMEKRKKKLKSSSNPSTTKRKKKSRA